MNTKRIINKRYRPPYQGPWQRIDEVKVHGRTVTHGMELSVHGKSGRHRFQYARKHSETGAVTLTLIGGRNGHEQFGACRLDQVKRVHRIAKTRVNA